MRAFLAQDLILFVLFFDLMLIPFYFLFGGEHPGRAEEDEGPIRPQPAVIKMFVYTLVGSLLMLAGAIATGILAADGGEPHLLDGRAAGGPARHRQPVLDLLVLRRRLPGEDAGLPAPRLDARRLPGRALPRSRSSPGCSPRSGLRLPSRRPADLPRRDHPLPGGDHPRRGRLHPLRLGDGVHPDERPAGRGLLLGGAARIHHAGDLQPAARRRRRRGPPDGQPRARRRAPAAHRGRARGARGDRRHHQWVGSRWRRRCSQRCS